MKKVFVACCLFVFAFAVSAQQGGGQGRMNPEQRYERMKSELSLTDKQLADIKKIDEEYTPKTRELFEKYSNDREKMTAEMTKLNEERNAKVKPLLSADQYTKYVEMNNRMRGGGRPGGGGGGGN